MAESSAWDVEEATKEMIVMYGSTRGPSYPSATNEEVKPVSGIQQIIMDKEEYKVCPKCGKLVNQNKLIIGSLHICTID